MQPPVADVEFYMVGFFLNEPMSAHNQLLKTARPPKARAPKPVLPGEKAVLLGGVLHMHILEEDTVEITPSFYQLTNSSLAAESLVFDANLRPTASTKKGRYPCPTQLMRMMMCK